MSHLGRPKQAGDQRYSLAAVGHRLSELLEREVVFVKDYHREPVEQLLNQLNPNQFVLLENLRFHDEEKANEQRFFKKIAQGMEFFVNDAFGACHRKHASIVGLPSLFPFEAKAVGLLIEKEMAALQHLRSGAVAPFTSIIGGAKVSDKIGAILSLLKHQMTFLLAERWHIPS